MVGKFQGTLFVDNPQVIIHDTYIWTVTKLSKHEVRISGEHIGSFDSEVTAHPTIALRLDTPLSYFDAEGKFIWYFEGAKDYMNFATNDGNIGFYGNKVD